MKKVIEVEHKYKTKETEGIICDLCGMTNIEGDHWGCGHEVSKVTIEHIEGSEYPGDKYGTVINMALL